MAHELTEFQKTQLYKFYCESWDFYNSQFQSSVTLPIGDVQTFFAREQSIAGIGLTQTAAQWFDATLEDLKTEIQKQRSKNEKAKN